MATISVGVALRASCLGGTMAETSESASGKAEADDVAPYKSVDNAKAVSFGTKHKYHVLRVRATSSNRNDE